MPLAAPDGDPLRIWVNGGQCNALQPGWHPRLARNEWLCLLSEYCAVVHAAGSPSCSRCEGSLDHGAESALTKTPQAMQPPTFARSTRRPSDSTPKPPRPSPWRLCLGGCLPSPFH